MVFADLNLAQPLLRALVAEGYTVPTPIQAQAIPHVLRGRDLIGCAQTGTGKTAAFALPILHRLMTVERAGARCVRALVLSPTRELASQIGQSFATYGRHTGLRHAVIFGGVGQGPQVSAVRGGADVLVATPGRLEDLMEQGHIDLRAVETFVLDEADQMLDMGFIHAIRRIVAKLPARRQNLLFSATMPEPIRALARTILRDPVQVQVAPTASTADGVDQSVYFVDRPAKPAVLAHFINTNRVTRALVFTRTKHGADKVARNLCSAGIPAEAIHGNKAQGQRLRALRNFKSDRPPVLVATDIAARGLDIDEVSHVINYDVPNVPETYVHRIGRTARAGATGTAVSFCDAEERPHIKAIERLTRKAIPVATMNGVPVAPRHAAPAPRPQHAPAHVRSHASAPHAGASHFRGNRPRRQGGRRGGWRGGR